MKLTLTIAISIISLLMSLFTSRSNGVTQEFRVDGVGVEADPPNYSGSCPGMIKFKGKIQASAAGRVKYTWLRSDGATGPVEFVDFESAGLKYVETTWTLGAAALPHYEGWQQLKVLSPNELLSNQAQFVLDCKQSGDPQSLPQPKPGAEKQTPQPEEKQTPQPAQTPNERLNLSAPAPLVPENPLASVLRQRVTVEKPKVIRLNPNRNFAGIFILKFVEGSHVRYRGDGFQAGEINKEEGRRLRRLNLSTETVAADLTRMNGLIHDYAARYGFTVKGTFGYRNSAQDPEAQFKEKEALEVVAGEELADLDLYYTIAAKDFKSLPVQETFMNELNRFASVEFVSASFLTEGASLPATLSQPPDRAPDLSTNQTYLDAAPTGIDARYAWTIPGGLGDGVKLIDVEYDWAIDHEDFAPAANRFWGGRPGCAYDGVDLSTGLGSGQT